MPSVTGMTQSSPNCNTVLPGVMWNIDHNPNPNPNPNVMLSRLPSMYNGFFYSPRVTFPLNLLKINIE